MRLRWMAIILLAALTPCSFADTVSNFTITQISISVGPNDGSGDNASVTLIGPGTNIAWSGGIACQNTWCDPFFLPLPAGQVLTDIGLVDVSNFSNAMVGGKNYDPSAEIAFNSGLFISVLSNVNLLANGSTSTVCAPATASSPITGFVGSGSSFMLINLNLPAGGTFCTTWDFSNGQYFFVHGTFSASAVPEPPTIGFMGLGMVALVGATIKQRRAKTTLAVPI